MNNRLIISSKECCSPYHEKITSTEYTNGTLKVQLLDRNDKDNNPPSSVYIKVSTDDEAIWISKAIFATKNNEKNLIINSLDQSITEVATTFDLNNTEKQKMVKKLLINQNPIQAIELC